MKNREQSSLIFLSLFTSFPIFGAPLGSVDIIMSYSELVYEFSVDRNRSTHISSLPCSKKSHKNNIRTIPQSDFMYGENMKLGAWKFEDDSWQLNLASLTAPDS
jgi:hypothetical protein